MGGIDVVPLLLPAQQIHPAVRKAELLHHGAGLRKSGSHHRAVPEERRLEDGGEDVEGNRRRLLRLLQHAVFQKIGAVGARHAGIVGVLPLQESILNLKITVAAAVLKPDDLLLAHPLDGRAVPVVEDRIDPAGIEDQAGRGKAERGVRLPLRDDPGKGVVPLLYPKDRKHRPFLARLGVADVLLQGGKDVAVHALPVISDPAPGFGLKS